MIKTCIEFTASADILQVSQFVLHNLNVFILCVNLLEGPSDGHIYRCVPALHAEHSGCDSFPAAHMDSWYRGNHGCPCYRLYVLLLREFFPHFQYKSTFF